MRENVKSIGLILALIIAGVSLPTSIISIMNKHMEFSPFPSLWVDRVFNNNIYNI